MREYSQKEKLELFEKLPQELKEVILSEETAERIWAIGQRYGIKRETLSEISALVGDILMGLLPPEEFPKVLEKELSLDEEEAKDIAREINRFILFPVKESLAEFYQKIQFAPGGRIIKKEKEKLKPETEKEKYPSPETDIYREPIE